MDTLVYRISATRHAESMDGSGMEARWNRENQFVLYTSSSMALACLEMLANCSADLLTRKQYSISTWFLPNALRIHEIFADELHQKHAEWYKRDNYDITQFIAEKWLKDKKSPVLKVPSAIIDAESNYLINPKHSAVSGIKLLRVQPFQFDQRLQAG